MDKLVYSRLNQMVSGIHFLAHLLNTKQDMIAHQLSDEDKKSAAEVNIYVM